MDVDNSDGSTIELLQRRQWLGSVDIERNVSLHLILMPGVSTQQQGAGVSGGGDMLCRCINGTSQCPVEARKNLLRH